MRVLTKTKPHDPSPLQHISLPQQKHELLCSRTLLEKYLLTWWRRKTSSGNSLVLYRKLSSFCFAATKEVQINNTGLVHYHSSELTAGCIFESHISIAANKTTTPLPCNTNITLPVVQKLNMQVNIYDIMYLSYQCPVLPRDGDLQAFLTDPHQFSHSALKLCPGGPQSSIKKTTGQKRKIIAKK